MTISRQQELVSADGLGGFDEMRRYPLFDAVFKRRSRRISTGIKAIPAGTNSYTAEHADPHPLTELEEAILIAAVGTTGVTLPDRPFETTHGEKILGTPNLNFIGRAAGSSADVTFKNLASGQILDVRLQTMGGYRDQRVQITCAVASRVHHFLIHHLLPNVMHLVVIQLVLGFSDNSGTRALTCLVFQYR